jgi:hypothetical protein
VSGTVSAKLAFRFLTPFPHAVPTRQQLLDKATEIDKLFGSQFTPPAGG